MLITESISLQLCKLIFTIISNQKQRNSRHWQGEIYRVFSLAMHSSLHIKCLKMQISCRENTDLHLIKAKCRILQMQNSEMQNAECRIQGKCKNYQPSVKVKTCFSCLESQILKLQNSLQAQGSEAPLIREFTMVHGKDTYFKQIETTQL